MKKSRNKKIYKRKTRKPRTKYRIQSKLLQKGGSNDESHCSYVSSHGIIKASKSIKGVHYVKSDHLGIFEIPSEKFVLVTGDEDTTIPDDFQEKANEILNSPNLIHWYSQNLIKHDNPKLSAIPIGLDYHTIANQNSLENWLGKKQSPKEQENCLNNLEKSFLVSDHFSWKRFLVLVYTFQRHIAFNLIIYQIFILFILINYLLKMLIVLELNLFILCNILELSKI